MNCDPIPGQMYVFKGIVKVHTWLITYVTEEGRTELIGGRHSFIKTGDLYIIVTLNDEGPYDGPDLGKFSSQVDPDGFARMIYANKKRKRWHVALLHDALFWLDHELLSFSELVSDAV